MKRVPVLGTLLLIPAVAMFFVVGCNSGAKTTPTVADKTTPTPVGDVKEIAAPGKGVIKGIVTFKGDIPEAKEITEMAKHKEGSLCLEAPTDAEKRDQKWLINKDRGVANVVISIEAPSGKKFKVDDAFKNSFKEKTVTLDQPYCVYDPRTIALLANVQPLVVKNSGKLTHNTKVQSSKTDPMDSLLAPKESLKPKTYKYEANPINISCSIHSWMKANLVVFDHPYFAVTKADGTFEISGIPDGEELLVHMWHESMSKKTEIQKTKAGDDLKLEISTK